MTETSDPRLVDADEDVAWDADVHPPGLVPPSGPKHAQYRRSSSRLGGGAFGEVLAGRRLATGEPVALKRVVVRAPDEGIPDNLLRELKTLQHLSGRSPHVVRLLDHYPLGNAVVLVLELCPRGDLRSLLGVGAAGADPREGRDPRAHLPLTPACVKGVVRQVFMGLAACHSLGVIHRDVKPGNVLVGADARLKLADFGLARFAPGTSPGTRTSSPRPSSPRPSSPSPGVLFGTYTPAIQTRWYRAPEILYGARDYSAAVDVWSAGAILAELLTPNGPILPGDSDIDQLARTLTLLGTPDDARWPDARGLPDYEKIAFAPRLPTPPRDALPGNVDPGLATDFLFRALALDPKTRPTAEEALRDEYFRAAPAAASPEAALEELRRCALRGDGDFGGGTERSRGRSGEGGGTRAEVAEGDFRDALVALGLDGELEGSRRDG